MMAGDRSTIATYEPMLAESSSQRLVRLRSIFHEGGHYAAADVLIVLTHIDSQGAEHHDHPTRRMQLRAASPHD
jgi:hypothetical protein